MSTLPDPPIVPMNEFEVSIEINAPSAITWSRLERVVDWPKWMPTVSSVVPISNPALTVGGLFRIRQPKLPLAIWTVTALKDGESFVWQSRSIGVVTVAQHILQPRSDTQCQLTLRLRFEGLLSAVATLVAGSLTRQYLEAEALALKRHAERDAGMVI